MDNKPLSVKHSIAEDYWNDARDFATRFDVLWEDQTHKTGRIKSFVDLLMSAECALKAHIFLANEQNDPKAIYERVRKAGHRIGPLADYAKFLPERSIYDTIKTQLAEFSVFLRYSLDAYDTFFPPLCDQAQIKYSNTVGNDCWVMNVRTTVDSLINSVTCEFSGFVSMDIKDILDNEQQVHELLGSRHK